MNASRLTTMAINQTIKNEIPYPYQEEAVNAIISQLKNQDRTHIVMACDLVT
jgi:superfamily II DNA or RNA helicase